MTEATMQEAGAAAEVAAQPDVTQEQVTAPDQITEAETDVAAPQTEKTFTQAEVEAIAAKERAIAERKADKRYIKMLEESRAQKAHAVQERAPETVVPSSKPLLADFKSAEEWEEATYKWRKVSEAVEYQKQQVRQREIELYEKVVKLFDDAEENNPEFDRVAFNKLKNVPEAMTLAIVDSDIPDKIMVHLTNNPKEADRIASMSPARQAAEIGKLEVKLSAAPEVQASKAPPPVKLPGARGIVTSKNPADMPQADFEKWLFGTTKR